ncbi:MAG: hypothetical protein Q9179_003816, partial [Wetmoreana sp. 5 TL-2023]
MIAANDSQTQYVTAVRGGGFSAPGCGPRFFKGAAPTTFIQHIHYGGPVPDALPAAHPRGDFSASVQPAVATSIKGNRVAGNSARVTKPGSNPASGHVDTLGMNLALSNVGGDSLASDSVGGDDIAFSNDGRVNNGNTLAIVYAPSALAPHTPPDDPATWATVVKMGRGKIFFSKEHVGGGGSRRREEGMLEPMLGAIAVMLGT